ncbi:unnamed protein product [Rotaria sp. Silwood1]|nr:unnamed protein product [Rotaria sp. Silwood1]CAF0898889.1 unnamed protein product [Rotaria sp. Silwood1]CAF3348931.1 unnamed protein product [Rotaria sp. Silwood1]CAF3390206.1 unnamed protein product [Rotaria sp. Silwood1]CAF4799084.1 unnamed protein product [Rotaria sp. Silwood1]
MDLSKGKIFESIFLIDKASSRSKHLYVHHYEVNTIFRQMEKKFFAASNQLMNRINELDRKIDTVESNFDDIISHLPSEESATTTTGTSTQQ